MSVAIDPLAPRGRFGVVAPATNTTVQPEFDAMRPFGVTNHHCRVDNEDVKIVTDSDFDRANASIAAGVRQALDIVMRCQPRQVILGMSSETFWNGVEASEGLLKELQDRCGVRVIMGAQACRAALELFGVKRLGVLTPYMPLGDRQVERYLTESGFAVVRLKGLRCQSPFQIGQTARTTLRDALRELDGDDIDALVQVGTNLPMAALASEAEFWLAKPVIAINTAIYWYALRSAGILDKAAGFGRLLAEH